MWDDDEISEMTAEAGMDAAVAVEPEVELATKSPKSDRWNRGATGMFARRAAKRITLEELLSRASLLPGVARGLITAFYEFKMPAEELAAIHHVTVCQLRRRLEHWRDTLADPSFLLFAEFGERLPRNLAEMARDYWIEGKTLREIAVMREVSLHRVRVQIAMTRSLLLVAMSRRQEVPAELAKGILEGRM